VNHDDKELLTPDRVGAELTRLRVARGWSQQQLADELGYTERYIGQLERGTKSPTLRTIADILPQSLRRYSGLRSGDI